RVMYDDEVDGNVKCTREDTWRGHSYTVEAYLDHAEMKTIGVTSILDRVTNKCGLVYWSSDLAVEACQGVLNDYEAVADKDHGVKAGWTGDKLRAAMLLRYGQRKKLGPGGEKMVNPPCHEEKERAADTGTATHAMCEHWSKERITEKRPLSELRQ